MKSSLLFIAFAFSCQLYAQENKVAKPDVKIFVRLYNKDNQKVGGGNLLYGNDSTIQLSNGHKVNSFPLSEIQIIKTKHGAGHNLLHGTLIGVYAGIAALGVASIVEKGKGESSFDIAVVGLLCPVAGFAAGGVAEAFRKSDMYLVNSNTAEWIAARKQILKLTD